MEAFRLKPPPKKKKINKRVKLETVLSYFGHCDPSMINRTQFTLHTLLQLERIQLMQPLYSSTEITCIDFSKLLNKINGQDHFIVLIFG